ncbi:MAG: hypothetical protein WC155_07995 [Candidatus Cloacimonadales bacterium]
MNSIENQYRIELFKRFMPRICEVINKNNTYAFVMNFDNDVLTINNVRVTIEYRVKVLEAYLAREPEVILGKFEMPYRPITDFPYLTNLHIFVSDVINKLNKTKRLDNIGSLPIGNIYYDHSVKDFSEDYDVNINL